MCVCVRECVYCSVHWKLQGRSVSNVCGLHQVQHMHVTDLRGSGEQMNLVVARWGGTVKVRHHLCSGSMGRSSSADPHLLQCMLGLSLECSEVLGLGLGPPIRSLDFVSKMEEAWNQVQLRENLCKGTAAPFVPIHH